jgi:hypothetical protein
MRPLLGVTWFAILFLVTSLAVEVIVGREYDCEMALVLGGSFALDLLVPARWIAYLRRRRKAVEPRRALLVACIVFVPFWAYSISVTAMISYMSMLRA